MPRSFPCVDSTTGVHFDENGIRRPIEYMKSLGIDMHQI